MKTAKLLFLLFLIAGIVGCASCVPGICGCSFSIWPSRWEEFIAAPALIAEFISIPGMIVCGIVMIVLCTRRRSIAETQQILARQDAGKDDN